MVRSIHNHPLSTCRNSGAARAAPPSPHPPARCAAPRCRAAPGDRGPGATGSKRKPLESGRKTIEDHGKLWKIGENQWKILENRGESIGNHGKSLTQWMFEAVFPQTDWGVLTVGVEAGLDQGTPSALRHFSCKFLRELALVRCPHAFRRASSHTKTSGELLGRGIFPVSSRLK